MRSIRVRLVALLLITLLPTFIIFVILANVEQARARTDAAGAARTMAQLMQGQFSYVIESTREKLEMVGLFPEFRSDDPTDCMQRLAQIYDTVEGYSAMFVADADGTILCRATNTPHPRNELPTVADGDYFKRAVATRTFTSGGSRIGEVSRRQVFVFAMPMLDGAGNVERVIGAGRDIDLLNLGNQVGDLSDQSSILILDDNGVVVQVQPNPGDVVGTIHPSFQAIRTAAHEGNVVYGPDLYGGERNYVAYPGFLNAAQPPSLGESGSAAAVDSDAGLPAYYAVVGYTNQQSTGAIWRTIWATLAGFALLTLATVVVAWFGGEVLIVRRIKQLAGVARRMSTGDLAVRAGIDPGAGEFGELALALNTLADSLQKREADNDRLLREVETFNLELEAKMEERTQELRDANTRLRISQQELRQLSQQLMRLTEQERTRISREIHDQLGQSLTAIKMELRTAQRTVEQNPERAQEQLNVASSQVDEMVGIVRRIAANLRPGVLDDFGIAAALDYHAQDFCERTGIDCITELELDEMRISPEMATAAFRIAQEALTNVARHAKAKRVTISGKTSPDGFVIEIRDDGVGFAPQQAGRTSLGMLGMRERAAELGGTVDFESTPANGAIVRLTLPYAVVKAVAEEIEQAESTSQS